MKESIFFKLHGDVLTEMLSYETSDSLYKHTRHVNKAWQKASMLVLVSRHASAEDILYQEKLFKTKFHQPFKQDTSFIQSLQRHILLSMASRYSTPTHKWHGSLFLLQFKDVASISLSDNLTGLMFELPVVRVISPEAAEVSKETLQKSLSIDQTQVAKIVKEITSEPLYEFHPKLKLLIALAPRLEQPQIKEVLVCFMEGIWAETTGDLGLHQAALSILKKLESKLEEAQVLDAFKVLHSIKLNKVFDDRPLPLCQRQ